MAGPPAALTALLSLAILFGGPSAPAQGDVRDARDAVKAVERAWRSGVTAERLAALDALALHDDPKCVDQLIELIEGGEIAMLPSVRRILGGYQADETMERLVREGLRHRSPAVRTQVLIALGEARPTGVDWVSLTEEALDDPFAPVRAAAVRALGRARAGSRLGRIIDMAADDSERVRMEVPAALVRLAGERSRPVLEQQLDDPRWRVRLAAIHALADIKTRSTVARLVTQLTRERGRLREDVVGLLERLTGRYHGTDVEAWRAFLKEAPDDFLTEADALALQRMGPPRYVDVGVRYYSIATASTRFVLLTDLSGSMETPVRIVGSEQAEPRLAITKAELTRLIEGLDADIAFNLVTFRDVGTLWKKALVPADERTQRSALAEVDDYKAWGATNIHGAMAQVFDMAERAMDSPIERDEDLDTLFLLSDGSPTAGEVRDVPLLLQYIAERNRTLQLRIHCLSLTAEPESRAFLSALAELGDGHYVELVEVPPMPPGR